MIGSSSSAGGVFAALVEAVSLCVRGRIRIAGQCSEAGSAKCRIHSSTVKQNSNGGYFKLIFNMYVGILNEFNFTSCAGQGIRSGCHISWQGRNSHFKSPFASSAWSVVRKCMVGTSIDSNGPHSCIGYQARSGKWG